MSRAPLKGCSGATQARAGSAPPTSRRSRSSRRADSSPAASPASASRWRARAAGSVRRPSSVRLGSAELAGGGGRSRTGLPPSAGQDDRAGSRLLGGKENRAAGRRYAGEARGTDQDVRAAGAFPRGVGQVPEHEPFAGARDRLRGAVRFGQIGGEALARPGEGGILGPAQGTQGFGGYEAEDAQQNGRLRGAEQRCDRVPRTNRERVEAGSVGAILFRQSQRRACGEGRLRQGDQEKNRAVAGFDPVPGKGWPHRPIRPGGDEACRIEAPCRISDTEEDDPVGKRCQACRKRKRSSAHSGRSPTSQEWGAGRDAPSSLGGRLASNPCPIVNAPAPSR